MTCGSRYAEAWMYSSFFCASGFASGTHQGAGPADVALLDARVNFINMGVDDNVGMVLYNITLGTSGPVTAHTIDTVTATGVTWNAGNAYRIATINSAEIATINMYLDITAADIHAALAATASCDCTYQSWVTGWLAKLNIIEAGAFHSCSCGSTKLSDEVKQSMLEWANTQLENLRNGNLVVCTGDTGKEYPAVGYAEIAYDSFTTLQIIENAEDRTP